MRAHDRLLRDLDPRLLEELDSEQARQRVERAAAIVLTELAPGIAEIRRHDLIRAITDEAIGFGPIQRLLDDQEVTEVMVNGPSSIYFERGGVLHSSNLRFNDQDHIRRIADRIVVALGRRLDEASPMVDARLPDGSRVNVVIPPLAPKSPTITVRKFAGGRHGVDELIQLGSMTEQFAGFMRACVVAKVNVVISGGTGTGKTTLLNAFSQFLPESERIVTIEDPIEIQLQQEHVVTLEARPAGSEGRGEVTQRDLVRNALRMRPDRIIVGEVRGSEAFDMLQAMNTGHEGGLTTVHANSARDALFRIENMVMMAGFELTSRVIREQMASALQLIIQVTRLLDGTRRVVAATEVSALSGDTITLQDLFLFENRGIGPDGRVQGTLKQTGIRPRFAERFAAFGVSPLWQPQGGGVALP
ncbi:MAG: CpaF family protein [Dehalococcoidia bacterium]|nr:CpaF family protein [Dehalococcoidia bacterium]